MLSALSLKVLGWVLPILLAPIVYALARIMLNAHARIDYLPAWIKRGAVLALGFAVTAILSALGLTVPAECIGLPAEFSEQCAQALSAPTFLKGLTVAVVAMLMHALKKAKPY